MTYADMTQAERESSGYDALVKISQLRKSDLVEVSEESGKNLEVILGALKSAVLLNDPENQRIEIFDEDSKQVAASISVERDEDNGELYFSVNYKAERAVDFKGQGLNTRSLRKDLASALAKTGNNISISSQAISDALMEEYEKSLENQNIENNGNKVEEIQSEELQIEPDLEENDYTVNTPLQEDPAMEEEKPSERFIDSDVLREEAAIEEDQETPVNEEYFTDIKNPELSGDIDAMFVLKDEISKELEGTNLTIGFSKDGKKIVIKELNDPSSKILINEHADAVVQISDPDKDISDLKAGLDIAKKCIEKRLKIQDQYREALEKSDKVGNYSTITLLENAVLYGMEEENCTTIIADSEGNSLIEITALENGPYIDLKMADNFGGAERRIDLTKYGYNSLEDALNDIYANTFINSGVLAEYNDFRSHLSDITKYENTRLFFREADGKISEAIEKLPEYSSGFKAVIEKAQNVLSTVDKKLLSPVLKTVDGITKTSLSVIGIDNLYTTYKDGLVSGIELHKPTYTFPAKSFLNGMKVDTDRIFGELLSNYEKDYVKQVIDQQKEKDPNVNVQDVKAKCYQYLRPNIYDNLKMSRNVSEYMYNLEKAYKDITKIENLAKDDPERLKAAKVKAEYELVKREFYQELNAWEKAGFKAKHEIDRLQTNLGIAIDRAKHGIYDSKFLNTIKHQIEKTIAAVNKYHAQTKNMVGKMIETCKAIPDRIGNKAIDSKNRMLLTAHDFGETATSYAKRTFEKTQSVKMVLPFLNKEQTEIRNLAETINDSFAAVPVTNSEFSKMLDNHCFYEVYEFKLKEVEKLEKIPADKRSEIDNEKIKQYRKDLQTKDKVDFLAENLHKKIQQIERNQMSRQEASKMIAESLRNIEASYNVKNGIDTTVFSSLSENEQQNYRVFAERIVDTLDISKDNDNKNKEKKQEEVR